MSSQSPQTKKGTGVGELGGGGVGGGGGGRGGGVHPEIFRPIEKTQRKEHHLGGKCGG